MSCICRTKRGWTGGIVLTRTAEPVAGVGAVRHVAGRFRGLPVV